jgi:hypothetical protein
MSEKQWWNDTDREKPKNADKNLFKWRFVYHKSYIDCPGRKLGAPRWEARD